MTYRMLNYLHDEIMYVEKLACSFQCMSKKLHCEKFAGRTTTFLSIHVKAVHENNKPCKCNHCERSFAQNGVLLHHVKIVHESIKAFKCGTCNKDFGTKGCLIRHNNETHENRNRINCHLCKNTYSRKEYLGIHMKVVHST